MMHALSGSAEGLRGKKIKRDFTGMPPTLFRVHRQRGGADEDEEGYGRLEGPGQERALCFPAFLRGIGSPGAKGKLSLDDSMYMLTVLKISVVENPSITLKIFRRLRYDCAGIVAFLCPPKGQTNGAVHENKAVMTSLPSAGGGPR